MSNLLYLLIVITFKYLIFWFRTPGIILEQKQLNKIKKHFKPHQNHVITIASYRRVSVCLIIEVREVSNKAKSGCGNTQLHQNFTPEDFYQEQEIK